MTPEEHVKRYCTNYDYKLKKICKPLEQLGVDTFWYYTISESGEYTFVGNKGIFGEYFCNNKMYLHHPSFRSPKFLIEGPQLWSEDSVFAESQKPIKNEFSMDQILHIGKKKDGIYHGYGFATTMQGYNLTNTYMNKLHLFKKFTLYFQDEAAANIRLASANKVDIASLIGKAFYEGDIPQSDSAFLSQIQKTDTLTPRERDCVTWLLRGRTASQIGQELGLSKRTVEHYLDNIKDKWGCHNKQELIDFAQDNFLV